jgi:AraC family transcriptional regulator
MSTSADTFADFVDHLAEALDGARITEATGEEWAARLHFSRYHFDRMIRSVAGEPPRAFRRRILLERAAYRMITTSVPLLDIAVEAGYGSHEAFTRAFTKAYGAPPAEWRRRPGHLQIAAPSDVHFHPPGSLRLPARDKVTSMDPSRRWSSTTSG